MTDFDNLMGAIEESKKNKERLARAFKFVSEKFDEDESSLAHVEKGLKQAEMGTNEWLRSVDSVQRKKEALVQDSIALALLSKLGR